MLLGAALHDRARPLAQNPGIPDSRNPGLRRARCDTVKTCETAPQKIGDHLNISGDPGFRGSGIFFFCVCFLCL